MAILTEIDQNVSYSSEGEENYFSCSSREEKEEEDEDEDEDEDEEVVSGSPSGASPDFNYDVFLSFRGEDTRLNFTDHLYEALIREGIVTFRDDEEVDTGEDLKPELETAIKTSRASIVVLSRDYASSTWCLEELVLILEQRKTYKHIVLPIFYHVEPTDVRKQQNSFAEALQKHQRRMEAETDAKKKSELSRKIENWKKSLEEVANLKGKDVNHRRETVFITEIIKEISKRLRLHVRGMVPHLIGMHDSVKTITSWLKDGSSQILTIWGMAGIGKTTLAKYIFGLNEEQFEKSSFLEDIERKCTSQTNGLLDLQKQLLDDILKESLIPVRDVAAATKRIKDSLPKKRILLVLDGIDKFEQIDALLGTNQFHPRTKIIITTKDPSLPGKCVLFSEGVLPQITEHFHEGLNETESLQLFSWHAFRCNHPKEGFEEVSEQFLKYCAGHPLAIKVLASSLLNQDVGAWFGALILLQKEVHIDILKVLQMSFDSLPSDNARKLFKYIACFFVGESREFTEIVLKACGMETSLGISNLIDRCLLSIGSGNTLMMHQLFQEMGRDIVRRESPERPRERSLLWCHEESFDVLKEEKGTINIQGVALDMKMLAKKKSSENDTANECSHLSSEFHLETVAFSKMDELKLLQINYAQVNGSYNNFPKGLRWLCWHGFPSRSMPRDLPMGKLVALDFSYSSLELLWEQPILLGSLKMLNVSHSDKLVRTGELSGLCNLERLIMARCASLVEVCESVVKCARLDVLDVSFCEKLKKLPIRKLKKLRELSVDGCPEIFQTEINDMSIVSQATSSITTEVLLRSPHSLLLTLPGSLVELSLANNNLHSESFPTDLCRLSNLQGLKLDENPFLRLPDFVGSLSSLTTLGLSGCTELKSALCLPRTVKTLIMANCTSLEKVALHPEVKMLIMADCPSLEKVAFHPESSTLPDFFFVSSDHLPEIEGLFKSQALATVDPHLLIRLGWTVLPFLNTRPIQLQGLDVKRLQIQMQYEFGIFSTYFAAKEVPEWFTRNRGSSISFTIPRRIRGLNICSLHTSSGSYFIDFKATVTNKTKNRSWAYCTCYYLLPIAKQELVWLSHWMFGEKELEDGDEVAVTISYDGEVIRECGISFAYEEDDNEEVETNDPLDYYRSWKYIIGKDLSAFEFTNGCYRLSRNRFWSPTSSKKHKF